MKKRIYICDDDPDILEVCRKILERGDYSVVTCRNAEEMLQAISSVKPDAIIMDIRMAGMGGEEAARILKTNDDTSQIPIILLSANMEIAEIAGRVKANAYLKKPFEISELRHVVDEYSNLMVRSNMLH